MQLYLQISSLSKSLQHGKLIVWNNTLYFGNSSNVPQAITVNLSSYATTAWVNNNFSTTSHTHSTYAPINNPTLTGNIHLNSTNIHLGPESTSSLATIKIGDGERIYLKETQDDHLEIYASGSLNLKSSSVKVNGTVLNTNSNDVGIVTGSFTTGSYESDRDIKPNLGFSPNLVLCAANSSSPSVQLYILTYATLYMLSRSGTTLSYVTTSSTDQLQSSGFIIHNNTAKNHTYHYIALQD